MSKTKKRVVARIMSVCICVSLSMMNMRISFAESKKYEYSFQKYEEDYSELVTEVSDWKCVDGRYRYPISSVDEEWYKLEGREAEFAACQVPDGILDQLDTSQLLQLVLDCPMLSTFKYYDNYYVGLKIFEDNFNAMHELLNRTDYYTAIMEYFEEMDIPTQRKYVSSGEIKQIDYNREYDLKIENTFLFCINSLTTLTDGIDDQTVQHAKDIIDQKYEELEKTEYSENIRAKEDAFSAECCDDRLKMNVSSLAKAASLGTLKTRGGKTVSYFVPGNIKKISAAEKDNVQSRNNKYINIKTNEPVVKVLGGTTGYNCYNFAWLYYDTKYKKKFWKKCVINSDAPYRSDTSSYHQTDYITDSYRIGTNAKHAVVVVSPSVEYRTPNGKIVKDILVRSKWAQDGVLAEHPLHLIDDNISGDINSNDYTFFC